MIHWIPKGMPPEHLLPPTIGQQRGVDQDIIRVVSISAHGFTPRPLGPVAPTSAVFALLIARIGYESARLQGWAV